METTTRKRTATAAIGTVIDYKEMTSSDTSALIKELETAKSKGAKKYAFFIPAKGEPVEWTALVLAIQCLAEAYFYDDRNPFYAYRWSKIIDKRLRVLIIDQTFTDSGTHWNGKGMEELNAQYNYNSYAWGYVDYNGHWVDVDYAACVSAFLNDSVRYQKWEDCRYGGYLDDKVNPALLNNKEYTYKG